MAQAPVGADVHQPPDILVDLSTKVALRDILAIHELADSVDLRFAEFIHARRHRRVQIGFDYDFLCQLGSYPINTPQGYVSPLAVRNVYSGYAYHDAS
jgi:hypothetical protein